jgi:hypothetical protein
MRAHWTSTSVMHKWHFGMHHLDDADHARNAVRTALQMMESLDAFNAEVTAEGIPAFGMGLGN